MEKVIATIDSIASVTEYAHRVMRLILIPSCGRMEHTGVGDLSSRGLKVFKLHLVADYGLIAD